MSRVSSVPRRRACILLLASLAGCSGEAAPTSPGNAPPPPPPTNKWSDPATWPGGAVPAAGAQVTIPAGKEILLDVSPPPLGGLTIDGVLVFDRKDLELSARWIQITGRLEVGTEASVFQQRAVITITGPESDEGPLGMASKAITVHEGGTLDLHGARRVGWARLAATAPAGATQVTLERDVDWRPGDRIVLASTDFDPAWYDEAVVKSVAGRVITLEAALKYAHWGQTQTVAGRPVDTRGEVGLLTRNVVVRGDAACASTGYCAHIASMRGGTMRIEGVELTLVGQKFRLARYPIHWHVAGDVGGQYARENSIWKSFNRCITVHGSHAASVERNVCHDHLGHGYFLEDGIEERNTIAGNLGLTARVPAAAERLLASDSRPATFWITNPNNIVKGNHAAGSFGFGFWYALPEHPTGMSTTDAVWPRRIPLLEFSGNVAHSNRSGALHVDDGPKPDGTTETTSYRPRQNPAASSDPVIADFRNFLAWKHRGRAVWLRGGSMRMTGTVLADNGIGATFAASDVYLQDGLVVGETANNATPFPTGFPIRGFEFYDGTVGPQRVTFANFRPSARGPASAIGFLRSNAFALSPYNASEAVTLLDANAVYIENPVATKDGDKAAVFLDRDGSITGAAGRYAVASVPILVNGNCTRRTEWNAYVCANRYFRLSVSSGATENVAPMTITRDDAVSVAMSGSGNQPSSVHMSLLPGRGYTLTLPQAVTRPRLQFRGLQPGDWIRLTIPYPQASLTAWRDYNTGAKLTAASSLAELDASAGDRYYYAGGMLHLKAVVQPNRDYATIFVDPK